MQPDSNARFETLSAPKPRPRGAIFLALLIIAVTLASYAPANRYDFADVDDNAYIVENLHIKYGLDWDAVKWAFTTYDLANWHPLTWLSHGLDCEIFHLNPGRHHNVNAALHGLDAALLFWVLLAATGYVGRSAMVAALFALHPINVESVVWIAERKTVLSMLFFLLALAAYRWYAERPGVARYLLVAFLFALGLMAKPQVITLPFVLLLWDYWPLRRMFAGAGDAAQARSSAPAIAPAKFSRLILEKLPLLALSAGSAFLTLKAQRAGGAMNPLNSYGFAMRMANAVVAYTRYLGKAIWPWKLSAFYPYARAGIGAGPVIASSVLLLAITAGVILMRQRRPLLVGWFWFLGTLVPMIGLVQVGDQSMADRYAYLPFIGLFIMACWGVPDLVSERTPHRASIWLAAPSLAILLVLMWLTHRQIGYWKSSVALWSHAVAVSSGNEPAEAYLGQALIRRSKPEEAIPHLKRAIALFPADPKPHMFLGYAEQKRGDPRAALEQYQKALDLSRDYGAIAAHLRAATLEGMAYAYRDLGDFARAAQCLEAAQQAAQP